MKIRQLGMIAAVGVAMLAAPLAANANGLGENKPWQFRSPSDLAVHLLQAELIEKVDGDFFKNKGPGNTVINNNVVTSIGNYREVNVGAGACNGPNACIVSGNQINDQSPTTAIGVGSNSTTLNGSIYSQSD